MNRYFYDREKHFIIDSYTNEIVCLVNYDEELFAIWVCRVLECRKDTPYELSDEILFAMREAYDKGIKPTEFLL